MSDISFYKKANSLNEVNNATRFDIPIDSDHEFYTDFSDVRGVFEEKVLYRSLNVDANTLQYNASGHANPPKAFLFLAGMRGSGKTSELAKIAKKLHHREGFFCVTCNLDDGLDVNDMEYMDILIFQLERLFEELKSAGVHPDDKIIASLQNWFSERVKEANRSIKKEGGFEVEIGAESPSLFSFIKLAGKLKASIKGSRESAEKIRTIFKHNFSDFAKKFNEFIEFVNVTLRKNSRAKELLFIVDGLEKTASAEVRRKIVLDEKDRIRQIKANTIFTLPIELTAERQRLMDFSKVLSFPFVKLQEKDGTIVEKAVQRFKDFTYKRIDEALFDEESTVRNAILLSGGSPREYLRLLTYLFMQADEATGLLTQEALEKATQKMAAETAQFLIQEDLDELKKIEEANQRGIPTLFSESIQGLLEKLILFEYNDGTYKRVNPIVEASEVYKYYVKNN
ncbi:MAG: hypothetical protein ACPGJS_22490 [Flammeovirgaceae bacterium]